MTTIEWLKDQCNKHSCGTCSSRYCLVRGGYESGDPDYSVSTCHANEAISELEALNARISELTKENEMLRQEVAYIERWRPI